MTLNRCLNFNHSRSGAPVRFCPQCGEVVNERISKRLCSADSHDKSRRNQNLFCVDCGEVLRQSR